MPKVAITRIMAILWNNINENMAGKPPLLKQGVCGSSMIRVDLVRHYPSKYRLYTLKPQMPLQRGAANNEDKMALIEPVIGPYESWQSRLTLILFCDVRISYSVF
jgi:hypothetical protein